MALAFFLAFFLFLIISSILGFIPIAGPIIAYFVDAYIIFDFLAKLTGIYWTWILGLAMWISILVSILISFSMSLIIFGLAKSM